MSRPALNKGRGRRACAPPIAHLAPATVAASRKPSTTAKPFVRNDCAASSVTVGGETSSSRRHWRRSGAYPDQSAARGRTARNQTQHACGSRFAPARTSSGAWSARKRLEHTCDRKGRVVGGSGRTASRMREEDGNHQVQVDVALQVMYKRRPTGATGCESGRP